MIEAEEYTEQSAYNKTLYKQKAAIQDIKFKCGSYNKEPADNRDCGATHKYQGSLSYGGHATSSKDMDIM
jgi:hypothetical protein